MNEPTATGADVGRQMATRRQGLIPISRERLHDVPVLERGNRSSRWAGVQHGLLANTVIHRAERAGLAFTGEDWLMSPGGERIFGELQVSSECQALRGLSAADAGLMEANSGYDGFDPRIMGISLGILSGNDGSWAMALIVIARVLVCSNGMTVEDGHITCRRLHTTGIERDLPHVIDRGLANYVTRIGTLEQTRNQLCQLDYTRQSDVDLVIVEAGRRGIMPWSALGKVEKEWREPRHPEFRERTGWSLANCFTQIGKQFNPVREIKAADGIRQLVIESAPNRN
jgi:Domain of unknown function (DUF932)